MSYDLKKWVDYGYYWVYEDDQNNIGSKQSKKGRPTGSILSNCIGTNVAGYDVPSPKEQAEFISGLVIKDVVTNYNIEWGIKMESVARKYYEETYNYVVKDVGFAIPKYDTRIGVAVDGDVYDKNGNSINTIIEIKCPQKMYKPLLKYINKGCPDTPLYNHIWRSHYDQMQMGMAVLGRLYCDYIVYCPLEEPGQQLFIERIPFNYHYWNWVTIVLNDFICNKLNPMLKLVNKGYPFLPPNS